MNYKNGVLSATFGILQQVLTLIFGLIVPRLYIGTFGSEMNGLLGSLSNIYGYLALVEAGVGATTLQSLYGPLAQKDKKAVNEIMSATTYYYNRAGLFYFCGVLIISILYPLTVQTTIPSSTIFILTLLSGSGGVINFWVQGKYMILLQAEGKKYLMSIVSMVVHIANNTAKILLIRSNYDVIAVHIGSLIISLAQMIFWTVYIKKYYKWLDLYTKKNWSALSQSKSVFIAQIMWMVCSNTDILVLTYVAKDLKSVSVYNVYLMIFGTIGNLFSALFSSFHYLLGQEFNIDKKRYMALHKVYEALSIGGSFALYSIAYVLSFPFIELYTAGITDATYVDPYLPLLFTIMYLLSSTREASSRVINFARHFKQMQWRAVLEAVINICCSIILVLKFGIYGVVIGTIVAYLYRTNDIIVYANRKVLSRSPWESYKLCLANILAFLLVLGINSCFNFSTDSFLTLFALAIPISIVISIVYLVTLHFVSKTSIDFLREAISKGMKRLIHGMS